jgi:hypothetical protein
MTLPSRLRAWPPVASGPVALACFLAACAGSPAPGAGGPASSLPAYAALDADQFDDTIEPRAVGLALEAYTPPKGDRRLRARAQASDVVVRVRVNTVTGESGGGARSYQVTFESVERLAGKHPLGDEFAVRVDQKSPSLGIVKSMEGQLVGKPLVMFAKAFRGADGEREIHFHAAPDAPDVVAAVKEAVILDEVK